MTEALVFLLIVFSRPCERKIRVSDELSNSSAFFVRIPILLFARFRVSHKAVLHLSRATSAPILFAATLFHVLVLDPVCAYAVGFVREVLEISFFALSAILSVLIFLRGAVPYQFRSLISDDPCTWIRVFFFLPIIWNRIDACIVFPSKVAELSV